MKFPGLFTDRCAEAKYGTRVSYRDTKTIEDVLKTAVPGLVDLFE